VQPVPVGRPARDGSAAEAADARLPLEVEMLDQLRQTLREFRNARVRRVRERFRAILARNVGSLPPRVPSSAAHGPAMRAEAPEPAND
jgi:hypothetical protein